MNSILLAHLRIPLAAFWLGVAIASTGDAHSLPAAVIYMAIGATITGLLSGALAQWELYVRGHNDNKSLAVIGTLFSGFAGFFSYAITREYIEDPLKIVLAAICAGIVGRPFVTEVAARWVAGAKVRVPDGNNNDAK